MEEQSKLNKWKITTFFLGAVIILMIVTSFVLTKDSENELLKTILKADSDISKVSIDSQEADIYYDLAYLAYENQDFDGVESNCKLARMNYAEVSQKYKKIITELKNSQSKHKLIEIYIEILNKTIEIEDSMYEACEHFESAARYYDNYYNGNVPYGDISYDMGSQEIGGMNEKIKVRDLAVEGHNQLLEDFRFELEKLIIPSS